MPSQDQLTGDGSDDAKSLKKGDGSDITMTFTDYDEPVPSETPSADDSIDVSKLQSDLEKI